MEQRKEMLANTGLATVVEREVEGADGAEMHRRGERGEHEGSLGQVRVLKAAILEVDVAR